MWTSLADTATVEKTIQALEANNIHAFVVDTGEDAKKKVIEMIPQRAEVFALSSTTLQTIGVTRELDESGRYDSVRKRLSSMDRETQGGEMRKLGAAPDWAVGSVHAVTQMGELMIASKTGSQLSACASGAGHLIFVVGTHKIVDSREMGFRRIYEHSLKLENERAMKAYGNESEVEKILLLSKEFRSGRTTVIFVKEVLGF